jgi:hypothetical protein
MVCLLTILQDYLERIAIQANSEISTRNTPECKSVTAEISPHFQPDQWNKAALKSANKHPLRFKGQLMYDASHRPFHARCPNEFVGALQAKIRTA